MKKELIFCPERGPAKFHLRDNLYSAREGTFWVCLIWNTVVMSGGGIFCASASAGVTHGTFISGPSYLCVIITASQN